MISSEKRGDDFHGGVPFSILRSEIVLGLRVCSIMLDCGFDNSRLLKRLDRPTLPHLIPWMCNIDPSAYSSGRFVVIEAEWPDGYQRDDITLDEVSTESVRRNDRIIVGVNSLGTNITLYARELEHLLIAGQTGSGKSYTLRSLVRQLGAPGPDRNMLVLLDGKGGEGLGLVSGISPSQVGPLAVNADDVTNALGWCYDEMKARYQSIANSGGLKLNSDHRHIFVVFDEFQVFTKSRSSPAITGLLNSLATQGRAAKIHVIACTQKPLVESWGDSTTPDQFSAAVAQRVKTYQASKAIVGGSFPRCDTLLPKGDAYVIAAVPNHIVERVQVVYVPENVLMSLKGCQSMMDEWPEFDVSGHSSFVGRPAKVSTPTEIAIGIEAVIKGKARHWYRDQFDNGDTPGAGRADRLLSRCGEVVGTLRERGVRCQIQNT